MGIDSGNSGNTRSTFVRRIGAGVLCAAALGGCTSVVSEKPVFPSSDFEKSDAILGVYNVLSSEPSYEFAIEREGTAGAKVIGLASPKSNQWLQFAYADAAVVPLGRGNYLLQMTCSLWKDDKGWTPTPPSMAEGYASYALAIKDQRANTYWLLTNFSDVTPDLLTHDGVVDPNKSSQSGDIVLPASMTKTKVAAFFRDVAAEAMTKAKGHPGIVEHDVAGPRTIDPRSDEAKAVVVSTTQQCQSLTEQYRRSHK